MKRFASLLIAFAVGCATLCAQSINPTGKVLSIDSRNYYLHVAVAGESLSTIAAKYGASEGSIVAANEVVGWDGKVREGDALRIPCDKRVRELRPKRDSSEYIYHTLTAGESLFAVAIEFAISLDVLIEDNPTLDITKVPAFSTLLIRESATRTTTLEVLGQQSKEYAELLGRLSVDYDYFLVEKGQTLYSISRSRGVSVSALKEANGSPEVIYVGMLLKAPASQKPVVESKPVEKIVSEPQTETRSELQEEPQEEVQVTESQQPFVEKQIEEPKEVVWVEKEEEEVSEWGIFDYLRSIIKARSEGDSYASVFNRKVNISMMLPLTDKLGRARGSFVEFYQGALIAAEDMKAQGYTVNIRLYDTQDSAERVEELIRYDSDIKNTDIFIGPIYERNAGAVLEYAASRNIPVVLPLETSVSGTYGDNFFRMAPIVTNKYDKVAKLISPNSHITLVYTPNINKEMESNVLAMLGDREYTKVVYDDKFEVAVDAPSLQTSLVRRNNLVFILSNNEMEVDRMLTMVASVINRFGNRGKDCIEVVGDAAWMRYKTIDRNLFFKLNVGFVAHYHCDRTEDRVLDFEAKYIHSFGRQPSTFSYRAYDAVKLFSTAMATSGDVHRGLAEISEPMLRTPYHFVLENGNMANDFWPFVQYVGTEIRVE